MRGARIYFFLPLTRFELQEALIIYSFPFVCPYFLCRGIIPQIAVVSSNHHAVGNRLAPDVESPKNIGPILE